ncbi:MAG: hypothetical protein ACLR6B_02030 [Blautia sp.]
MKGERTLSDPLVSKLVGEQRVILGVPIYQGGVGEGSILDGSYDLAYLGSLVFEDLYDENGLSVSGDSQNGEVISLDHSADDDRKSCGDHD